MYNMIKLEAEFVTEANYNLSFSGAMPVRDIALCNIVISGVFS